jgi:hypothetical protein
MNEFNHADKDTAGLVASHVLRTRRSIVMKEIESQRSTNPHGNKNMALNNQSPPGSREERYLVSHGNQHQKIGIENL